MTSSDTITAPTSADAPSLPGSSPTGPAAASESEVPKRTLRERAASVGWAILSAALFVGLWQLLSMRVGSAVLPRPVQSVLAIGDSLEAGHLWSDMRVTAVRIAGAFALALTLAVIFGVTLGMSKIATKLFGSWVTIAASIPSLLYIVIAYLWIGLNDRAAIIGGALVVLPTITFNMWQGLKSLDPDLSEMARAFGVSRRTTITSVLLPQTLPFIFAASRLGLALTWKIMIFVELLGRSSGVGYRIQFWYNLFNMERVLAAAIPFICVMLTLEFAVLRPLERHLFRWKREESR
jgi:NitT/TauT family transport system permease protein